MSEEKHVIEGREFGGGNVVRSIRRAAKDGFFKKESEINNRLDSIINFIEQSRGGIIESFNKSKSCNHDFGEHSSRFSPSLFGVCSSHERVCKLCGKTEYAKHEIPDDWG